MKKVSIIGIIVIVLLILLLFGSSITTHHDISYRSSKFKTSVEKKKFQLEFEKYLIKNGYRKADKNPEWALTSFGKEEKRKISFYVRAEDKNHKSIFYLEDSGFDDKVLVIMYIYTAKAHPLFIDSENEKMREFGLKIAKKFPGLTINSDSYMTIKLQK